MKKEFTEEQWYLVVEALNYFRDYLQVHEKEMIVKAMATLNEEVIYEIEDIKEKGRVMEELLKETD